MLLPRLHSISTTAELLDIRQDWQDLWDHSNGAYFHDFTCAWQCWISIHQPQGRQLYCLALREGYGLVALLPMVIYRRGFWRIAKSLGPDAAEGCDVLVRRGYDAPAEAAKELWQHFLAQARPDFIDLGFIKRDSVLAVAANAAPGQHLLADSADEIPYAKLKGEADWESYKATLSKTYQSQMARKVRRLAEQGKVGFECVGENAAFYTNWLLATKRAWAVRVNKRGSWIFSPFYEDFLGKLADSSARVQVFVLSVDGAPVSVKVVAINPSYCNLIIGSYDQRYQRFSPGSLLDEFWMHYVFQKFHDQDGRHLDVDFGAGKEVYKLHWSRQNVVPTRSLHIATSRWGAAPHYLRGAADGMKRLLREGNPMRRALVFRSQH